MLMLKLALGALSGRATFVECFDMRPGACGRRKGRLVNKVRLAQAVEKGLEWRWARVDWNASQAVDEHASGRDACVCHWFGSCFSCLRPGH